jgi:DNA-binding transcriptional LysR family regulator
VQDVDVNRLRVFRAVVASGTVQAAAGNLGYSPSAVSQHLAALQRETGLTLFEKAGRGIVPTAAGRLLAARSDEVMDSLGRLTGLVADLREGRSGTLSIGTFASAGEAWIPHVAKALAIELPDVILTLDIHDHDDAPRPPYDIELSTEHPHDPPNVTPGSRRYVLLDEPFVLLVPHDHHLAGRRQVPLGDLADERWIDDDPHDTSCGRILRAWWRAAGLNPHFVARTSDHHASIAFVAAGVGVAIVPRLALGMLPPAVAQVRVVDPEPTRRIVACVRDDTDRNPAVSRAMEILRGAAAAET